MKPRSLEAIDSNISARRRFNAAIQGKNQDDDDRIIALKWERRCAELEADSAELAGIIEAWRMEEWDNAPVLYGRINEASKRQDARRAKAGEKGEQS